MIKLNRQTSTDCVYFEQLKITIDIYVHYNMQVKEVFETAVSYLDI